jgi:Cu(I)/Ag(I) efflux system membrane protein CusA/SilA
MIIPAVIRLILRYRILVWLLVVAGICASAIALVRAPLDAIPDISDPQVVIYVKWPRSPQLLESEVTEPLVSALTGTAGVQAVRGTSHMGYSFIYVILDAKADREAIQQLALDRINAIRPQLPPDANVSLGPNASSMGWIYQYALVDHEMLRDLRELRLLNESRIKPALQAVPGIAEVASVGGLEKQYQLKIFPPLLAESGIPLRQVITAVQGAFGEIGGRTIEVTNREYQLRGVINNDNIDKLEYLMIGKRADRSPVFLKDIGYIQVGYDLRRSTVDLDGKGEVVGGIVIMEHDRNVLAVTRALERKLTEVRASLPQGVEIVTAYDRADWIWSTLKEFFATLGVELGVLILVTAMFLKNLRTSIGPIAILLFSVLFTALPLAGFSQTINLFSLAGLCIAIGEIADATIVMVENCAAELAAHPAASPEERVEIIIAAISRVTKPLVFSLLIILASFAPVFFLEEREARLFDPLAYSKTFAMGVSTLLTLFLMPIVIVWIFNRRKRTRPVLSVYGVPAVKAASYALLAAALIWGIWTFRAEAWEFLPEIGSLAIVAMPVVLMRFFRGGEATPERYQDTVVARFYRSALQAVIRRRYVFTVAGMLTLIPAAIWLVSFPKDFLPDTDEGSILYMPTTLPGLPTREAGWVLQEMDKKLMQLDPEKLKLDPKSTAQKFPEIDRVFGKLGRADTSTDPAPVSMV